MLKDQKIHKVQELIILLFFMIHDAKSSKTGGIYRLSILSVAVSYGPNLFVDG